MSYRTLFIVILFLVHFKTSAQVKNYATEVSKWTSGIAVLADGRKISGEFNYNFITGVLSYRDENGTEPYSARTVKSFILEYVEGKEGKYYSMPYSETKWDKKEFVFFELLYQSENVAILSKHEYDFKDKRVHSFDATGAPTGWRDGTYSKERVFEYIFLADEKGNVFKYGKKKKDKYSSFQAENTFSINKTSPETAYAISKTQRAPNEEYRIIDKDAIEGLTKSKYPALKKFINKQRLSLNTIEELSLLFDHYVSIK